MTNAMAHKSSGRVIWFTAVAISFNFLIILSAIYTLNRMDTRMDETMRAVNVERYVYETIVHEKNTLININNLTLVNEYHTQVESDIESIIQTLDYIDNNFTSGNIHTKSETARKATLKYQRLYLEGVFIIEELMLIKQSLEEQGKIIIIEVADYVQDKFGAHKTNKEFRILQRLNTSMRIWINATQIRLHQKEYIQTRKEQTIHAIKLNFDAMKTDMLLLRGLADNDFEKLKTQRFIGAAMQYEISSNRWLKINQKLSSLLNDMQLLSDSVLIQARSASQEVVLEMNKQNSIMRTILQVIFLLLMSFTMIFTVQLLRKKDA